MKFPSGLISILFCIIFYNSVGAQNTGFFNVKNYGAVGDGVHLDTDAINQTIQVAAEQGGELSFFRLVIICVFQSG